MEPIRPAHIMRFENMKKHGRALYLLSTAFSVAGVIAAIQLFSGKPFSVKTIALYAFIGAVVAQLDWLRLKKRYDKHNSPSIES